MFDIRCEGCGTFGSLLCTPCSQQHFHPVDAPKGIYRAFTTGTYDSPLGRALAVAKHRPSRPLSLRIARAFGTAALHDAVILSLVATATQVTWIPSTRSRLVRRGFSLPAMLAAGVARPWGLPATRILSMRAGAPQSSLDKHSRWKSAKERIYVTSGNHAGTVILVDDVVTTGASAEVAADELSKAGFSRVVLLTCAVAKAPQ